MAMAAVERKKKDVISNYSLVYFSAAQQRKPRWTDTIKRERERGEKEK